MSLRTRLLAAIFLALLISFSLGAGLAAWRAASTMHDELAASLFNARQSASAALANLPAGPDAAAGTAPHRARVRRQPAHARGIAGPRRDGARCERARRVTAAARLVLAPRCTIDEPVLAPVSGVPGIVALRLQADPVDEAAERWTELRERVVGFAIFFALAGALCSLTAARSLRPLTLLAQGLARVGRGEAQPDMAERGPPEIATLARAFNAMSAALNASEAQNRRLSQQVLTIAEEERSELARDLHDEIGPLLFAITTFTATIGRQVETGDLASVPAQVLAIQDATARLQREVRDMLGRLHDSGEAAPANLPAALAELLAFWRSVRPETNFVLRADLPGQPLSDAARECLFRAAQEGISNAVRHGRPHRVNVHLHDDAERVTLVVADDGIGGMEKPGRGLAGMRARVAALRGGVAIARGAGWNVTVRLPPATLRTRACGEAAARENPCGGRPCRGACRAAPDVCRHARCRGARSG